MLFTAVKNKYCFIDARYKILDKPALPHKRLKNWNENTASRKMESEAILRSFHANIENLSLSLTKCMGSGNNSTLKTICEAKLYGEIEIEKIEFTVWLLVTRAV